MPVASRWPGMRCTSGDSVSEDNGIVNYTHTLRYGRLELVVDHDSRVRNERES